jgi:two-component system, chemotaxis family, CheB/CheR fusion protein
MTSENSLASVIVGIGASAGGLAAFKEFFAAMPADTGMAFVLVQHLDPQHQSMLVELLRPQTTIPVAEAKDGVAVAANSVYVIPRNATLTIQGGVLRVVTPAPERPQRRPIDMFFAALAEDQGERAVAIVLSGVGSDGSLGVQAIKEHGGLTLAQAEFNHEALQGMPRSAAATGFVDLVVPIEAMPGKLIDYKRHLGEVAAHKDGDGARPDVTGQLAQIVALLRARTGHDFGGYKDKTLSRRVQRRMQVLRIEDVATYIDRLKAEPTELDRMFHDFLIGVTEFFRNPEAFAALSEIIPKLIAGKGPNDQVRIWVPGCATGEEAYSIAIMMHEAKDWKAGPKPMIFATDIDANGITVARAGHYQKLPPGLSPERFARWFRRDGDAYCPIKEIRDLCVFSEHNVIKDPPFSKLDLISCRNVLIYFNDELQHRAMRTFHYALRPGGYLFLGPSESTTREAKLFAVVDKKHRILRRRDVDAIFPNVSPTDVAREPNRPDAMRPAMADVIDARARRALEPFSPAYFVIDARNEIIRFSGAETGHYLQPSSGPPSLNLFAILRKGLRQAVRSALQEARAQRYSVARENLSVRIDGQNRPVTLIIEPIGASREAGLWVVAFRDTGQSTTTAATTKPVPAGNVDVQALEQELRQTKSQLQDAINDLERHIEQTQIATEEYQSVNEELQASNEELETAKEEMQSINEELQTLNTEMNNKNQGLLQLNSDLQNLMDNTEVAIVFLDQELRIKNFTPAIANIFPLRDGDRGRSLMQIVSSLIETDVAGDLSHVQRTLTPVEREVKIKHADAISTWLMRIRPYRTVDNRIDGVVVTFVDINAMALANAERARFAALARASGDAILGLSLDGVVDTWSPGAERLFGYTAKEMIGRNISILTPEGYAQEQDSVLERIRRGEEVAPYDSMRRHKEGGLVHVAIRAAPILSTQKVPIGVAKTMRDIAERVKIQEHNRLLTRELAHRSKNLLALMLAIMSQTAHYSSSTEDFARRCEDRLRAISNAQDLLLAKDWKGAAVVDVVRTSLRPFLVNDSCLEMLGSDIELRADAVHTFSLVLHELATNAAKFGALTKPEGKIIVDWGHIAAKVKSLRFRMSWRETGGPPVVAPRQIGFGHEIMTELPKHELAADVNLQYPREGLVWEIDMPADLAVTRREES